MKTADHGNPKVVFVEVSSEQSDMPPGFLSQWMSQWAEHPNCLEVTLLKSATQKGMFLLHSVWTGVPESCPSVEGVEVRCWTFDVLETQKNTDR